MRNATNVNTQIRHESPNRSSPIHSPLSPFQWHFANPSSGWGEGRKDFVSIEMTPVRATDDNTESPSARKARTIPRLRDAVTDDSGWQCALHIPKREEEPTHSSQAEAEASQIERSIELIDTIYGSSVPTDGYLVLEGDGIDTEIVPKENGAKTWLFKMITARGAPFSGNTFVPDPDGQSLNILTKQTEFSNNSNKVLEVGIGPKHGQTSADSNLETLHDELMKDPVWSQKLSKALKAQLLSVSEDCLTTSRWSAYHDNGFKVRLDRASKKVEEQSGIRYRATFEPLGPFEP